MTGWIVAAVLAIGLVVMALQDTAAAKQNRRLRKVLDEVLDRAERAGTAFTVGRLRRVVDELRDRARLTADQVEWRAFHNAAHLVEREHIAPLLEELDSAEPETAGVSDG